MHVSMISWVFVVITTDSPVYFSCVLYIKSAVLLNTCTCAWVFCDIYCNMSTCVMIEKFLVYESNADLMIVHISWATSWQFAYIACSITCTCSYMYTMHVCIVSFVPSLKRAYNRIYLEYCLLAHSVKYPYAISSPKLSYFVVFS